jgi:fructose/tagatose bisphosphate aldolase
LPGFPREETSGCAVAELGPLGHPVQELFESGKGFTDVDEAARFARETGCDWLSVAIGNIHGAISGAAKSQKKVAARLSIERLDAIREATNVPLVLHGGSGIRKSYVLDAFRHGIAKINIGTVIRQAYENNVAKSVQAAQQAVYDATVAVVRDELEVEGSVETINPASGA